MFTLSSCKILGTDREYLDGESDICLAFKHRKIDFEKLDYLAPIKNYFPSEIYDLTIVYLYYPEGVYAKARYHKAVKELQTSPMTTFLKSDDVAYAVRSTFIFVARWP